MGGARETSCFGCPTFRDRRKGSERKQCSFRGRRSILDMVVIFDAFSESCGFQKVWQAQCFVDVKVSISWWGSTCEPQSADFVIGAALCEPRSADFVASTALCEP